MSWAISSVAFICSSFLLRGMKQGVAESIRAQQDGDPRYMFRKWGANFLVRFEGEAGDIPNSLLGAQYVHKLLQNTHVTFSAVELRGGVEKTESNQKHDEADTEERIEALKERATELNRELSEARDCSDETKENRLMNELEQIALEVKSLEGLGGRVRPQSNSVEESARVSVRGSMTTLYKNCREKYGLKKIASHLSQFIDTGKDLSYRPSDPAPDWNF